jgi:hypothetical protein
VAELRPPHTTDQDDSLTHQVRFTIIGDYVSMSCNCRKKPPQRTGQHSYSPIRKGHELDLNRIAYNDPANHWKPFEPEDEAKW